MTQLDRLVDSVLVPGFVGTTAPDWLLRRLEGGLAGVCWFGHNISDSDQARALADQLHAARAEAVVICDEEGGTVTRLEAACGSSWPGHAALGRLDDPDITRAVAAELGLAVRAAGIDVALAPVADVNSDPENPVIGVRSFGAEPELVARHTAAFVEGLQSAGVAACAKHYPGHGATKVDSHLDLPTVRDDVATVRARDLVPFAAAVRAGVASVMTAHVRFPAFDEEPATMSARLLGLLRDELGFAGPVLSDALDMKAVAARLGRGPGAVRALAAGVDLVCIGNPRFPEEYDDRRALDEVADAVRAAVEDGTLSRERLEEAAHRVRMLAHRTERLDADVAHGAARGADAARRALAVAGDVRLRGDAVVVDVDGAVNMAAGRSATWVAAALRQRRPDTQHHLIGSASDLSVVLEAATGRELVAVMGHRPSQDGWAALDALLGARADTVVVYTGLPGRADPGARTVHTFGGGRASAEAVTDLLTGGAHP